MATDTRKYQVSPDGMFDAFNNDALRLKSLIDLVLAMATEVGCSLLVTHWRVTDHAKAVASGKHATVGVGMPPKTACIWKAMGLTPGSREFPLIKVLAGSPMAEKLAADDRFQACLSTVPKDKEQIRFALVGVKKIKRSGKAVTVGCTRKQADRGLERSRRLFKRTRTVAA